MSYIESLGNLNQIVDEFLPEHHLKPYISSPEAQLIQQSQYFQVM